jgi:hypothetical protein
MQLRTDLVEENGFGKIKNYLQYSKIKPGTIHKLKTIRRYNELRMIGPQTQHKNPEHIYFKLLTPLTPSVEKIVKLCGFK